MSLEITHDDLEDVGRGSDVVKQFEIVILNNHNNTYYPGQYVEGHVLVDIKRAFRTRGL